ncbi:FlxA-like family protein [Clostridium paraputrificum]|uniref:FlxA-like family protein n=1 Tax=Clostridium TaxID=1485 RepID=UPI003D3287D2
MRINAMGINFSQNINKASSIYSINREKDGKEGTSLKLSNKVQNKAMESLEKLKENFLEQKQALKDREMDPEEKKYKMKEINENIQQVEAQMQQLRIQQKEEEAEKVKEEIEKKKSEEDKYKQNGDEVRDGVIISASLNELIEASHSMKNIHNLKDIKNREKIESMYIGPTDNPNTFNSKRMAQIKKSEINIEASISKEIKNINKGASKIQEKVGSKVDEIREYEENEEQREEKENSIED